MSRKPYVLNPPFFQRVIARTKKFSQWYESCSASVRVLQRELAAIQGVILSDEIVKLQETDGVAEKVDGNGHSGEAIEAKLTDLRLQLEKREESLAARELALSRQEADWRTSIQNLHLRLQETEAKLASRERELKQKESLIDAAAVRETEIGRFIERLSSECEKLSAELCEKRLLIGRLQDKPRHSTNGGKMWKKVLGLAHEEAS